MSQIQKISKNNTTTAIVDGAKVCTLHATQIVTFWENARKVKLDTRGWFTPTTRTRMTQCFRQWGIPLSVGFTKNGNHVRNYQTGQEYEFGQDNTLVVTY